MNGIPDECEIAGYMTGETPVPPVSDDCNGNGLLDECEIAWHIVADTNENGIPDPCEEEYRSITGETPVPHEGACESSPSAEAYAELVDWMLEQEWGPNASTTTAEEFAAFAAKCAELGLPVQCPQLAPAVP